MRRSTTLLAAIALIVGGARRGRGPRGRVVLTRAADRLPAVRRGRAACEPQPRTHQLALARGSTQHRWGLRAVLVRRGENCADRGGGAGKEAG